MDTTPMHGLGVLLFFLAFTIISVGCLAGGSFLPILVGIILAGISLVLLRKAKTSGVQE